MIKKKKRTPLWSAEHPSRKKAIRILEHLEENFEKYGFKLDGTEYYEVEDKLTNIINERG